MITHHPLAFKLRYLFFNFSTFVLCGFLFLLFFSFSFVYFPFHFLLTEERRRKVEPRATHLPEKSRSRDHHRSGSQHARRTRANSGNIDEVANLAHKIRQMRGTNLVCRRCALAWKLESTFFNHAIPFRLLRCCTPDDWMSLWTPHSLQAALT